LRNIHKGTFIATKDTYSDKKRNALLNVEAPCEKEGGMMVDWKKKKEEKRKKQKTHKLLAEMSVMSGKRNDNLHA